MRLGKLSWLMLFMASGCSSPTGDQPALRQIRADAQMLSAMTKPSPLPIPKSKWPPAIASLHPTSVTISPEGVDILISPGFDGGSGYFVPSKGTDHPDPAGRFELVGQGIYWYHPY